MIDPRLLPLAQRNVPRYTSYPTAPHFSADVDANTYGEWLDALEPGESASLYLHVPYCRSICFYCGCSTKATRREEPLIAYGRRLLSEVERVAARTGSLRITHLHWGGGTPSLLPADAFSAIMDGITARFTFAPGAERAIELDPRYVTRELAQRLAANGINRASLGIQDFDSSVQAAIGRIQPLPMVHDAVDALREAGIDDINMDLIYGLPGQTLETMARTVRTVTSLQPARVALFGYAHVPWMRPNQRLIEEAHLPDVPLRHALAETARDIIEAEGYMPVGIDHFARPDDALASALRSRTLKRNFQGYTTDASPVLLGFGASSIGRLPQGYVQNITDSGNWMAALDAQTLPVAKGRRLTAEDRLRGEVISQILCFFDVDLLAVARDHHVSADVFAEDLEKLAPLEAAGFIKIVGGQLKIVHDAPALARIVASAFDAYLTSAARHSVAV